MDVRCLEVSILTPRSVKKKGGGDDGGGRGRVVNRKTLWRGFYMGWQLSGPLEFGLG